MECLCTIEVISDYEPCHTLKNTSPIARKDHKCDECGCLIPNGDQYLNYVGIFGRKGRFFIHKTCTDCKSIRDVFFSDGFLFETLWEDLHEYIDEHVGEIPENCITELTPKARNKVCELIEQAWEYSYDDEDEDE